MTVYRSYLVRVWAEDGEQEADDWEAEVQQIQSGESWTFSSREALIAFFRRLPRLPGDPKSVKQPRGGNR